METDKVFSNFDLKLQKAQLTEATLLRKEDENTGRATTKISIGHITEHLTPFKRKQPYLVLQNIQY